MVSTISQAENVDSQACVSVLFYISVSVLFYISGHLLNRNQVLNVRAAKCLSDAKHHKSRSKRRFRGVLDVHVCSVLQINDLLGSNAVQREFHTNSSKVSLRR